MKKLTLTQFCKASHIDASLIRSVVRQIGGWKEFTERAQDVTNHGASGGFSGFTYYSDTVSFTKRNKKAIVTFCENFASDLGDGGIIEFITGFQCMKNYKQSEVASGLYDSRSDFKTTVYNALAWLMLEEISRSYCDITGTY